MRGDGVTPQEMVHQFHKATNGAINLRSGLVIDLRERLLAEEWDELSDELNLLFDGVGDLCKVAKEMADMAYVLYGTAVALGIDLDKAVALVHESNMSKLGPDGKPILREDGKVLKGPDYFEPDMSSAILESTHD